MIGRVFAAVAACGTALILYCCVAAGKRADEQAEYWTKEKKADAEEECQSFVEKN